MFKANAEKRAVGKLAMYGFPPHHFSHNRGHNLGCRKITTKFNHNQTQKSTEGGCMCAILQRYRIRIHKWINFLFHF